MFTLNQCIHVKHLDHHLLCLIQCRMNGVEVNKTPKFLLKRSTDTSHAIVVDETDRDTPMIVPLSISVVTGFLCVKTDLLRI